MALYKGDGGGLYNIPADALGDIDRLKSGSIEAIISPNLGFKSRNWCNCKRLSYCNW